MSSFELSNRCGAGVEQWPDAAAAQQRADYLKAVLSAAPILGTEYATLRRNLLLRVISTDRTCVVQPFSPRILKPSNHFPVPNLSAPARPTDARELQAWSPHAAVAVMSWLRRKKFVGSYSVFNARSRSRLGPYASCRRSLSSPRSLA